MELDLVQERRHNTHGHQLLHVPHSVIRNANVADLALLLQLLKRTAFQACLPIDNVVYVGTMSGIVYALDAETGDIKWKRDIDNTILGAVKYNSDSDIVSVGALVVTYLFNNYPSQTDMACVLLCSLSFFFLSLFVVVRCLDSRAHTQLCAVLWRGHHVPDARGQCAHSRTFGPVARPLACVAC
mgnify:CR=1 FL=1